MLWLVPGVDVFGSTIDTAFKMGEDISEKEVLITVNPVMSKASDILTIAMTREALLIT